MLTHPSYFYQPYLLETDSLGNPIRTRMPLQLTGNQQVVLRRLWNDLVVARDGSGFFLTGEYRADATNNVPDYEQGIIIKLDTALNVVWQRLLPPQRASGTLVTSVREDEDGMLRLLGYDGPPVRGMSLPNRPYLYVFTLSASGQLLSTRETITTPSTGNVYVQPYDWQPIAGDSAFYVSGLAYRGGRVSAWAGKYVPAARPLGTHREQATPVWLGEPYPNPASGAGAVVRLPYGWRAGAGRGHAVELRLVSALGQVVARQPIEAPTAATGEWGIPLAGRAAGLYHLLLVVDGQTRAARRLVVE